MNVCHLCNHDRENNDGMVGEREENNQEKDRGREDVADGTEGFRGRLDEVFVDDYYVPEGLYQRVGLGKQRRAGYQLFEDVDVYCLTDKLRDICF